MPSITHKMNSITEGQEISPKNEEEGNKMQRSREERKYMSQNSAVEIYFHIP